MEMPIKGGAIVKIKLRSVISEDSLSFKKNTGAWSSFFSFQFLKTQFFHGQLGGNLAGVFFIICTSL